MTLTLAFYALVFLSFAGLTGLVMLPLSGDPALIRRMRELRSRHRNPYAVEQAELATPFTDRVVIPAAKAVSRSLLSLAPESFRRRLAQRLTRAGMPASAGTFLVAKLAFAVGGATLFGLVLPALGSARNAALFATVLGPMAGVVCFGLPEFWLASLTSARRRALERALPDVMDLLCISVEAGLGFDGAMQKVAEKFRDPVAVEFTLYLNEVRLGKPRADALRDLARRSAVSDFQSVMAAIVQADELGVSLGRVLRVQAAQMRQRRRQRAEEQALKTPIKILFPLVLLIFPTVFMVLLGPVLVHYLVLFSK
jgi:tight adherence protein C